MTALLYHGTVSNFTRFKVPECGIHFGTLDQAAHAATIQLGRMKPHLFAALKPDANGWRGRIIQAQLHFEKPKRVKDAKTSKQWERSIRIAQDEGYDCLVYVNDFEGRKPADSFVVWCADLVKIVNPNFQALG